MSNLFATLEQEAFRAGITPRTKESRAWFRKKVQDMTISRQQLMKDKSLKTTGTELVGSMNMFYYDPKTKETLPFYDRFPLAIIVGPAEGGFYGLNLHYLPMNLRAKLLDALLENTNNKKLILLHCKSVYPPSDEYTDLNNIDLLKESFKGRPFFFFFFYD